MSADAYIPERVALVLGGGGLKGFAHIGVLRAFEERGIKPTLFAGTSIGALLAAGYAGGMSVDDMEKRAVSLRKKDLFRIDHIHMVTKRMLSPSLYLGHPLEALVADMVPATTFRQLDVPLLVNTVDLERGSQVIWGLPGFQDVAVADAVYASCALPGFFPPRVIKGRTCADGGVVENVPAAIAAYGMDAVIGVDVGSTNLATARRIKDKGFAAIYMRAAQTMMKSLQSAQLSSWTGPPFLLIRPPVWQYHWFSFIHAKRMIDAGYAAAHDALNRLGDSLRHRGGVYPRRAVELSVDRGKCTGCRLCVTLAPNIMALDDQHKATVMASPLEWSRADGDFVNQCPADAIRVEVVEEGVRRLTMEHRIETE